LDGLRWARLSGLPGRGAWGRSSSSVPLVAALSRVFPARDGRVIAHGAPPDCDEAYGIGVRRHE
jgi:hypothetical protein